MPVVGSFRGTARGLLSCLACITLAAMTSNAIGQAPAQVPANAAAQPTTAATSNGPNEEARVEFLRKAVESTIASFDKDLATPGGKFEARQFTLYAHYVLALGQPPEKAERALKRVLAMQEMNPRSPQYGEFPTVEGAAITATTGDSGPTAAVTEVTVLPMVQVMIRYGDKLSPELRDQMTESLRAALGVIRKHQWSMDLANVYLQAAADELLIGELLRDQKAIGEAQARLSGFATIARSRGIEEYCSPNYTTVQLSALLIAQRYTLQPDARRIIDPLVKYMWAQVASSVVPGRGTMGGSHSREVDFIYGLGSIDCYLLLEGMRNLGAVVAPFSDGLRAYTNYVEGAWRPDDQIKKLATQERVVRMRWGLQAGHDRYLYVNDVFAMGSASATATSYDKKLVFDFAAPRGLPTIWVVPDKYDSPYGHVRGLNGSLLPANHLPEQIAAVQQKTTMLALMNYRDGVRGKTMPSVATNVVFPAVADEVRVNGQVVATDKPFEMNLKPDSTILIRIGPGALVVRLFDVDGIAGQQTAFQLKFDGNPWGIARLVAYHYRASRTNPPRPLPDQPMRAGVIYLAAKVESPQDVQALLKRAADAKLESNVKENAWQAKLVDGATTLEAGLDLQTGAILTRKVNGAEYQSPPFDVNDRDLAGELLGY